MLASQIPCNPEWKRERGDGVAKGSILSADAAEAEAVNVECEDLKDIKYPLDLCRKVDSH